MKILKAIKQTVEFLFSLLPFVIGMVLILFWLMGAPSFWSYFLPITLLVGVPFFTLLFLVTKNTSKNASQIKIINTICGILLFICGIWIWKESSAGEFIKTKDLPHYTVSEVKDGYLIEFDSVYYPQFLKYSDNVDTVDVILKYQEYMGERNILSQKFIVEDKNGNEIKLEKYQ